MCIRPGGAHADCDRDPLRGLIGGGNRPGTRLLLGPIRTTEEELLAFDRLAKLIQVIQDFLVGPLFVEDHKLFPAITVDFPSGEPR